MNEMKDLWTFDKKKYVDKSGEQWLFVTRSFFDEDTPFKECPYEVYFRNASRTYFGCLRTEHIKDNPYKHEKLVEKVLLSAEFREAHYAPETKEVWRKNWK